MHEHIHDGAYVLIAGWMVRRLQLHGIRLHLYATIYAASQDGDSLFSGSLDYLCAWAGATRPTVIKALRELVETGLVERIEPPQGSQSPPSYRAVLPPGGGKEILPRGGVKKFYPPSEAGGSSVSSENRKESELESAEDLHDAPENPERGGGKEILPRGVKKFYPPIDRHNTRVSTDYDNEESRERKKEIYKERKKEAPKLPEAIAEALTAAAKGDTALHTALVDFAQQRAAQRQRAIRTVRTVELLAKRLEEWSGGDRAVKIALLEEATLKGWMSPVDPRGRTSFCWPASGRQTVTEVEHVHEWQG